MEIDIAVSHSNARLIGSSNAWHLKMFGDITFFRHSGNNPQRKIRLYQ